ncbi:hypothetical protein [Streptomonospora wellingtoniae]|uniref:PH domain-containing protein n=1 Tax=Streptomonospora wellingtoniae TaxID=3075544 RepID=A0ABU2KRD2_9ACTN|nr:hypothetical protein [Streptomonospora sp. DSM 45055]MDT0301732.1 hypothetical protein [Streptomonospora sp. DSM 45055]
MRYAPEVLALRPDTRKAVWHLVTAAVVMGSLVITVTFKFGLIAALVGGAGFTALIAGAVGHLIRSRIELTADEIVLHGLFFQQRRLRSRAAEVVRAEIHAHRAPPGDTLFLLDTRRELVLRVAGTNYAREDMDRLVRALAVPCSGPDRPVTAGELAKMYPDLRMVTFIERYPVQGGFAIAGILIAMIVGLMLVATVAGL